MRCDVQLAKVGDEPSRVVGLVAGDRATPFLRREPTEHLERGVAFGVAGRPGQLDVHDQCVAVLHQQVSCKGGLRRGRERLAGHAPRERS